MFVTYLALNYTHCKNTQPIVNLKYSVKHVCNIFGLKLHTLAKPLSYIYELYKSALKHLPVSDRKRMPLKTSSVTGSFIVCHSFQCAE